MTTDQRLEKLERELANAKRRNRRLMIGAAVCLGMILAWEFFAQSGRIGTVQAVEPTTAPAQRKGRPWPWGEDAPVFRKASDTLQGSGPTTAPTLLTDEQMKGLPPREPVKVIRATAFVLVDDEGRERAKLEMRKDGPGLAFYDQNGSPRATLGVEVFGMSLVLADENGKARVMQTVGKDGPTLSLLDKNEKPRVCLGYVKAEPSLDLFDANGEPRVELATTKDGTWLSLSGEEGKGKADLSVVNDVGPNLCLFGKGKGMATLNADTNGAGMRLTGLNAKHKVALSAGEISDIVLYDDSGKVRVKASVFDDGPASLLLTGQKGKGSANLIAGLGEAMGASLCLRDETERGGFMLFSSKVESWLRQFDEKGKVIWHAP
ncbi:MAG: hypothetical protein PHU85_05620 [Phycisphaerae bacterium]|nr:hypothetical protein [Phycisphaerae bacterium]